MKTVQHIRNKLLLITVEAFILLSCQTTSSNKAATRDSTNLFSKPEESCQYKYDQLVKSSCGTCHIGFNKNLSAGGFTLYDLAHYSKDSLDILYQKCLTAKTHHTIHPIANATFDSIVFFFDRYCKDPVVPNVPQVTGSGR